MEVLVSLVIFSLFLGMATQFVAGGMKSPFIIDRVEPWSNFMEESLQELNQLVLDSELLEEGVHSSPFPKLSLPPDLEEWSLTWVRNNLPDYQTALFVAKSRNGKEIQWRGYKKIKTD